MIHTNELPLRHLFTHLDGGTSGPRSFNGPIGQLIVKKGEVSKLSVLRDFQPIKCDPLPDMDRSVLSKDQQYLWDIHRAVRTKSFSQALANRVVGECHHARWLNLASSILRYYVTVPDPSAELVQLVEYIMKVLEYFC